jgi:hypothetical protein
MCRPPYMSIYNRQPGRCARIDISARDNAVDRRDDVTITKVQFGLNARCNEHNVSVQISVVRRYSVESQLDPRDPEFSDGR